MLLCLHDRRGKGSDATVPQTVQKVQRYMRLASPRKSAEPDIRHNVLLAVQADMIISTIPSIVGLKRTFFTSPAYVSLEEA